ncbi:MAG: acyltransferase [Phycisphaera sp.]|nr:acyltransferase [Phycisphaera sp.]
MPPAANNLLHRVPVVNARVHRAFAWYGGRFLRKHFHGVRIARDGQPHARDGQPLIVYLNHPSWWDPMVCLHLSQVYFKPRTHFAPIDAVMLEKYRFFEKVGFFGIQPDSPRGGVTFIRTARAILESPRHALWITAQGRFTDPRERPVSLRPGLAHLLTKISNGTVLPLAVEYPFWDERKPEALVRFGQPIEIQEHADRDNAQWQALLEERMTQTMDQLTQDALSRDASRFESLLRGRSGVNVAYDLWRSGVARIQRKPFRSEHGATP